MDYTIEQLKAYAYDLIVQLNNAQAELNKVNQAITDKTKVTPTEKVKVEEVKE